MEDGTKKFFAEPPGYQLLAPLWSFDWKRYEQGDGLSYVTEPFTKDTVLAGPGQVDLWISADEPDADVQATVSVVRPDDTEYLVSTGLLRLGDRKATKVVADPDDLRLARTYSKADYKALPKGKLVRAKIAVPSFAQAFRAGDRLADPDLEPRPRLRRLVVHDDRRAGGGAPGRALPGTAVEGRVPGGQRHHRAARLARRARRCGARPVGRTSRSPTGRWGDASVLGPSGATDPGVAVGEVSDPEPRGEARPAGTNRRGRATRERILQAAEALLAERGLDLTLDDVARAAGATRMTVHRHTGGREELLTQVVLRESARLAAALREVLDADRPLDERLVDALTLTVVSVREPRLAGAALHDGEPGRHLVRDRPGQPHARRHLGVLAALPARSGRRRPGSGPIPSGRSAGCSTSCWWSSCCPSWRRTRRRRRSLFATFVVPAGACTSSLPARRASVHPPGQVTRRTGWLW